MPDLGLVTGTIRRSRGLSPQMPLVNMFSERAITEPRQFSLLSFPGLSEEGTVMGTGPIKALFQKDGVLGGALHAVSGRKLYGATALGDIAGIGVASIAGNENGIIATVGERAVFWSGSDYSVVEFPDHTHVRKVIEEGGRFVFLASGTQRFYWTMPYADALDGNGRVLIDALDYASAESEPDQLVDALGFEGQIALGGTKTIEHWTKTGDDDLPYVPIEGRVFQKGVRATGCMAVFDNSYVWVSPQDIVYRAGNVPERISDGGIEELIAGSTSCRVDSYFFEGHEFLKVALDDVTIEFDAQTRQWHERKTGVGNFAGGAVVDGPLFGSTTDGRILAFGEAQDLGSFHEKSFCAAFSLDGGTVPISNVRLRTNPGATEFLSGDYANPTVELVQSYDWGQTFADPLPERLGEQGEYRRMVEWRALGIADAPGFFAKFRVTDPVSVRVSGATLNERTGGRSR